MRFYELQKGCFNNTTDTQVGECVWTTWRSLFMITVYVYMSNRTPPGPVVCNNTGRVMHGRHRITGRCIYYYSIIILDVNITGELVTCFYKEHESGRSPYLVSLLDSL